MAGRTATLTIQILAQAAQAQAQLKGVSGQVAGLQSTVGGLALPAAAALGAITVFGAGAVSAASDAEQAFGALESVFGDQAAAAQAFADQSASAAGLSAAAYSQMAAVIGAQLKRQGTAMDDLAPATNDLIQLGADLAAQYGGSTADAVAAIGSLMRGERDPIERYAVGINEATIQARLAADGLSDLEGEALAQAKTQATLAILFEQTADAQGAFARESDTAAGSAARSSAAWEDAKAALGTALLPVVAQATEMLGALATMIGDNTQAVQIIVGVIAILAGGILALNVALKAYQAAQVLVRGATVAWTAVQWLLNAALTANPIGLVVAAIVALIAILVIAWNKSETFRKIVTDAFEAVMRVVQEVVATIGRVWATLTDILIAPFRAAKQFIDGIMRGISSALEILPGGKAAPAPATAGLTGARSVRAAGATGGSVPGRPDLRIAGEATITHRIEDPGGVLAGIPGGAAAVARELNRGTDALPLFRNLTHAAGIR